MAAGVDEDARFAQGAAWPAPGGLPAFTLDASIREALEAPGDAAPPPRVVTFAEDGRDGADSVISGTLAMCVLAASRPEVTLLDGPEVARLVADLITELRLGRDSSGTASEAEVDRAAAYLGRPVVFARDGRRTVTTHPAPHGPCEDDRDRVLLEAALDARHRPTLRLHLFGARTSAPPADVLRRISHA